MALDNIQLDIVVTLQGSQAIKSAEQALRNVANATNNVRQKSSELQPITLKEASSWDGLTEGLGRVERRYDAVFRAGAHMTMMGQQLIGSSRAIAQSAMGIVSAYEGYDMMLRRGAVALNVNEEWQGKLDKAIKTTAQTIGLLKPEEVAEGYYIWGAAAGVVVDTQKELNDITAIVEETMIATAMAGGTLEGNLNGVYGVMSQFNLPMSSAVDIIQKLALMTERTAAQFPDLINSMTYLGPLADSIGISFEDVTGILGLLADAGQKGSRAGRGLAMVIEGLSAPSGPAGKALDGLMQKTHGMNAEFNKVMFPDGEFIGMRGFINEMAEAVEGLTDAERGRLYATSFTNNATRALIPVIEDQIALNKEAAASGREWTSVLDGQKYSLDGAGEFFENMRDKALGSITAITGRLEASFFPTLQLIATEIMDMAMPVIETIGEVAIAFSEWLALNPELVQTALRIAGITAVAMAGAGILFSLGGAVMYLIGNLGVFFQGIGRILGPFGLLIGLFVGFGVAIWNNVGGIRNAIAMFAKSASDLWSAIMGDGELFSSAWSDIWGGLQAAAEWVIEEIADLLVHLSRVMTQLGKNEAFTGFMRTVIDLFLRFRVVISILAAATVTFWAAGRAIRFFTAMLKILSGYTMIKGIVLGIAAAVSKMALAFGILKSTFAAGGMKAGIAGIIALLGGPLALAIGAIALIVGGLYLAWENNWFGIRDIVANVVGWFANTLVPWIGSVVDSIIGAWNAAVEWFQQLPTHIGNAWQSVLTWVGGVIEALVGVFNGVVTFFAELPGKIGEFLAGVWATITGWIGEVLTGIGEFIVMLYEGFIAFFVDLYENWDTYLGLIIGTILGFIVLALVKIGEFLVSLVTNIVEWISKAPGIFADWLGQTWDAISTWIGEVATGVWNFMAKLIADIGAWIAKAPGVFKNWLFVTWTEVSTWFVNLVTSVGAWMGSVIATITDWISKAPGRFMEWLGRVWADVSAWFSGFVTDAGTWTGNVVRNIVKFFKELPGKAVDAIGGILTSMKDWFERLPTRLMRTLRNVGGAIIGGVWAGITGAWAAFYDSVMDFFGGVVDGVMNVLGIASPSKVFAGIGGYMMEGLAMGIEADTSASSALNKYANNLVGIASGTTLGFSAGLEGMADGMSVSSDGTKTIRIEMDLTSSDGSYDNATLEQLKAALTGSDLVRSLERMAEAG